MTSQDEMLKALSEYRGPIKKLRPGGARGAGDLKTWAMRRADGKSGVPNAKVARKIRKEMRKAMKQTRRQKRRIGIEHGTSKLIVPEHEWRETERKVASGELVVWDDTGPPPWE